MSTKSQKQVTTVKMSPSLVYAALDKMYNTNKVSMFLWGPPGISKSAVSQQFATDKGIAFIDIRLSQMDPTDLRGIPYPVTENGITGVRWSAPLVLPRDIDMSAVVQSTYAETLELKFDLMNPKGVNGIHYITKLDYKVKSLTPGAHAEIVETSPTNVIVALYAIDEDGTITKKLVPGAARVFVKGDAHALVGLEEFNSAPQSVQAASYQLILDKRLGEYEVPKGVYLMAMGNRDIDRGITFKMTTAISNRFTHIEMEANFENWQQWGLLAMIHPHVMGFLSAFNEKLFVFDPNSASRGFATPRSWSFVSDILNANEFKGKNDYVVLQGLTMGSIGDGMGSEFLAFRDIAMELPDVELILNGKITKLDLKTNDQKTSETQIMYALATTMLHRLNSKVKKLKQEFPGKTIRQMGDAGKEFFIQGDNFFAFMLDNFRPEITLMGVRSAFTLYKLPFDLNEMKTCKVVAEKYAKYVLQT